MLFGGNKSGGKSSFPGYELKTGVLCSLPATSGTANGGLSRALQIPANCIPLCVKVEPEFKSSSGKGETSSLILEVFDNNGNYFYRASRNDSGWISGGTAQTQYLCPLGAYNGDLEAASTITSITIAAHNSSWGLISDYKIGKISVTMWLEKKGAGGIKPVAPNQYKRLYLFKDGDQCTDVTGGWTTAVEGNGGNYTSDTRDNSLFIGGSGNGRKFYKPANAQIVPSETYDYIFFEFKAKSYDDSNGGNCEFTVNGETYVINNRSNRDKTRIIGLPLSAVAVSPCFCLSMGGNSTSYMWVYKVWLEMVGE